MAIIQGTSAQLEVDGTFKAARTSIRPMEALGWHSIGARSGAVTGVAAAGALFSFRNLAANPVAIRRIGVGFVTTTAFTTAQELAWALQLQRSFTASDTGGTTIALTGSNGKHRTSLATPSSLDVRISTTGALTGGTKTADANTHAIIGAWSGGAGVTLAPAAANLFSHDPEDYPLILAQNEGFNIFNQVAMGAAGVGTFYTNIEFAEATAF